MCHGSPKASHHAPRASGSQQWGECHHACWQPRSSGRRREGPAAEAGPPKSQDVNSGGPARPGSSAERLLPPENGRRSPQCGMLWQYVLTPNARRDTVARCGEAQRTEGGPDAPAHRPHNQTPGAAGGETLRVRSSGSASFKSALQ